MILLRSLQLYQAKATCRVTGLSSSITSRALIATSKLSSLTGTTCLFQVFASDVSHCLPSRKTLRHHLHVTQGYVSLSENVDDSLSGKLPAVESVKLADKAKSVAIKSENFLAKDVLSHTKHVLKSDSDAEKTETHIYLDESKREVVVYVYNAFVKTKATDLYHVIRKMDNEQVLSLVEHSHHVLDKTHLALCMKRLFTLSTNYPQLCDADVVRQDRRFQILCASVAKKSRYLQPAILNDIVMFLCHFGVTSFHAVMQVCLQLMMKQINNLSLDQLTTLAHELSVLDATKQTRVLREAIAVLCGTRGDQLVLLSVEDKIYLLEEFGCRLHYASELLESLWDDRRDLHKWQQAGGFFIALAKAATPTETGEIRVPLTRQESLEEWCMDILRQQYKWLNSDDVEALLAAFILLGIYDGELLRLLGDHIQTCSSNVERWLSVWNLLADADYLHVGLMEAVLMDLKTMDVKQLSTHTQLALVSLLAEAANYYHNTSNTELSDQYFDNAIFVLLDKLSHALQKSENIPADLQLDTCLYLTLLHKFPPDLLCSHILDTPAQLLSSHEQSLVCPTLLDKLVLLLNLQNSYDTTHARLSELAALVQEQSRPQSALHSALLMACHDAKHGHTTSLGFYADHLLPSKTVQKRSVAVLCWYDSHHFWINTNSLKCIPHLYAATMQRLQSYNVLVVNVSAWLSLSERERFMHISTILNKELQGLTVT